MSYIVENNIQLEKNFKLSEFACKHCGKVMVDMELVHVLQKMRDKLGRINVEIGYRCPEFNAAVCKNDPKASKNSYHMYGKAADLHLNHAYDEELQQIAEECGARGIGIYDTFVHVDVGTKRKWDYRTKKDSWDDENLAYVVEVDPLQLSTQWMQGKNKKLPSELVKTIPNFVNCMFYGGDDRPFRLLVHKGKVLSPFMGYDKKTDKGTLIIYDNGSVEVKTIGRDSNLDISRIHLAFQGFNLDYEANGSTSLRNSMREEGWASMDSVGRWDDYVYEYNSWRPGFGYNAQKKKVIIAVKKTDAAGIRMLMRELGCKTNNNDTCAIGGDSGGSIAFCENGELKVDGKRKQVHILTW